MKTALKITTATERPRLAAPAASARRGIALHLVARRRRRLNRPRRSVRSGGHERVLRVLDRLALFGMVVAIALMPVLAAGHSVKQPAVATAAATDGDGFGFFRALSAAGYAIWRPTPSRPVSNPSQQDRSAPAPRHFPSTN